MLKDKGLIIGVLVTLVIFIGGVYYFSGESSSPQASPAPVTQEILMPIDANKTAGSVNGNYLVASESAKVTLVEFGDFQCPACGQYHPLVKQLLNDFAGKINFVFRNYPLTQHKNAQIAAQAVEAAGLQGKYWQMHDKVYESQNEWSNSADAKNMFISYAQGLGLNSDQFKSDIDSSKIKTKIQSDQNDGNLIRISATPTYFLNGVQITSLPTSYEGLKSLVNSELAK